MEAGYLVEISPAQVDGKVGESARHSARSIPIGAAATGLAGVSTSTGRTTTDGISDGAESERSESQTGLRQVELSTTDAKENSAILAALESRWQIGATNDWASAAGAGWQPTAPLLQSGQQEASSTV